MEQALYKTIRRRGDHNIHHRKTQVNNHHINIITSPESGSQRRYEKETRENEINISEAISLMLNDYQEHQHLSVKANEYWRRHIRKFALLFDENNTENCTILTNSSTQSSLPVMLTGSMKNEGNPIRTGYN